MIIFVHVFSCIFYKFHFYAYTFHTSFINFLPFSHIFTLSFNNFNQYVLVYSVLLGFFMLFSHLKNFWKKKEIAWQGLNPIPSVKLLTHQPFELNLTFSFAFVLSTYYRKQIVSALLVFLRSPMPDRTLTDVRLLSGFQPDKDLTTPWLQPDGLWQLGCTSIRYILFFIYQHWC